MSQIKKIESLTPEQSRQLIDWRDYWLTQGRSTEPADRLATETTIAEMYAALGKKRPIFWWCDGPATGSISRAWLKDNLGANLGDNLWANLGNNLRANLGANLGDNLRDNLRDNLGDNLWANLRDNLWANLGNNLQWYFWGQHECYWQAWLLFPHKFLRPMHTPEQIERLSWWITLSKNCGWWMPYDGIVFVCERPTVQSVDEQGRLHNESGPAIRCRDGWEVYAWHNVRVPRQVIVAPETLTPNQIFSEANTEIRRLMITRFGEGKLIEQSGATIIHSDEMGELYSIPMKDDENLCMVKVFNSTPEPDGTHKPYWLRIDPEIRPFRRMPDGTQWKGEPQKKLARNAVASTFGMTGDEYATALAQQT